MDMEELQDLAAIDGRVGMAGEMEGSRKRDLEDGFLGNKVLRDGKNVKG